MGFVLVVPLLLHFTLGLTLLEYIAQCFCDAQQDDKCKCRPKVSRTRTTKEDGPGRPCSLGCDCHIVPGQQRSSSRSAGAAGSCASGAWGVPAHVDEMPLPGLSGHALAPPPSHVAFRRPLWRASRRVGPFATRRVASPPVACVASRCVAPSGVASLHLRRASRRVATFGARGVASRGPL